MIEKYQKKYKTIAISSVVPNRSSRGLPSGSGSDHAPYFSQSTLHNRGSSPRVSQTNEQKETQSTAFHANAP